MNDQQKPFRPLSSWNYIKTQFPIRPAEVPIIPIGTPFDTIEASNFNFKMTTKNFGKRNKTAQYIILHYTVSDNDDPVYHYKTTWNDPTNENKPSADFNIGRTGKIAGIRSYKSIRSNHYGKPTWPGYLNGDSIGIEIESFGFIYYNDKDKKFYNDLNKEVLPIEITLLEKPYRTKNMWHYHPDVQISALANLIIAIYNDGGIDKNTTFLSNCVGTSRYDILFPESGLLIKPPPGILTHGSGRDNKVDTFPQANLIQMLDELPTLIKNNPKTYIKWTL